MIVNAMKNYADKAIFINLPFSEMANVLYFTVQTNIYEGLFSLIL